MAPEQPWASLREVGKNAVRGLRRGLFGLRVSSMLGQSYLGAGQYEEAFQAFMEGASRLEPAKAALHQRTYEELGMEGLLRVFLDTWVWRPYDIAGISALLGEDDQAFAWLEKSYEATNWTFFAADPRFDSLRRDPRYEKLLRTLILPEDVIRRHMAD